MKKGFFLLLFLSSLIYAKTVTHQINNLLLYQEQKKIYNTHNKQLNNQEYNYSKLKELPIDENNSKKASCVKIDYIKFEDITLLSKKELYRITDKYLHKCDTLNDIHNIVKKINNLYIKKAYITSRAYIKPQNMKKGKLTISAIEGKINLVKGDGVSTKLLFPFAKNKNLNLRELESKIEQINRLESQKATMKLYPAEKKGYSNVVISSKKVAKAYNVNIGVNNFGVEKTGEYQINGSLNIENPLGINDLLSLSANTTDKQNSYNNSLGSSISYALPIGKSYMGIRYSSYDYVQRIEGKNQNYKSEGKTTTGELFIEYKLFHTQKQRGKFDLTLSRKETDNYISGVYLKSSSNVLSILRLGYMHSLKSSSWSTYSIFKYHRGLDIFGAKSIRDDLLTFDKYTLDLNFNKRFHTDTLLSFNSSLHAQYAKEGLIGTEYIGVGGPYSVRGFKSEYALSGNSGVYIRNDLSPSFRFGWGMISLYFGVDYGWVEKNEFSSGGSLVGSAIGTKISWRGFLFDVYKSYPLRDSNDNDDNNGFVGASISYRF